MLGRSEETTTYRGRTVIDARGGISGGAVLTGVVVAFGAMFLLSALVGGILTAIGVSETTIGDGEAVQAGIGAGIALVVAQFLSYMWGGYTAGRMGRGAGVANGVLVPLLAILLAIAVGAVVASLGATANLNLPWSTNRLPLENDLVVNWGLGISVAALAAMFIGGALGGSLGARWHTKLERHTLDETPEADRHVDVTDRATTGGAAASSHERDRTIARS
ncbi:MAG TPA: TIGR04086 family membrane protein [Actinomycetota bacterium]|nr:TIGR04086 family membrane protein [Actinomycetota bacterium]